MSECRAYLEVLAIGLERDVGVQTSADDLPADLRRSIVDPIATTSPNPQLLLSALDTRNLLGDRPEPVNREVVAPEDAAYVLLNRSTCASDVVDMLEAHAAVRDYKQILSLLPKLRARCKLNEAVVDVLFQPQVEREKTLYLNPRPIHLAILEDSPALVSLLLRAASRADQFQAAVDSSVRQRRRPNSPPVLSPGFLAVLFGGTAVGQALLAQGSAAFSTNQADIQAASKLRRAAPELWATFVARASTLGLGAIAETLEAGVKEREEAVAQRRAAAREAAARLAARRGASAPMQS